MGMRCPACQTHTFEAVKLAKGPAAMRCSACRSLWISLNHYFAFLENVPSGMADAPGPASPQPAPDSSAVKMCPQCAKFMRYYPVGHGLEFGIDRCGACGGFFLNDHEWDALVAAGLGTKLHFIPSDAWQAEVARTVKTVHDQEALARRLGAPDAAELERVTAWIGGHPHRDVLLAHLRERFRVLGSGGV